MADKTLTHNSSEPPVTDLTRRIMQSVRGKDTSAELRVRRALHALGYRYRLFDKRLPGRPDIVLSKLRTVIFVHGCFWHRHENCRYASTPKTRTEFWTKKFKSNVERDSNNRIELEKMGWEVIEVWECDIKKERFLDPLILKLRQIAASKISPIAEPR